MSHPSTAVRVFRSESQVVCAPRPLQWEEAGPAQCCEGGRSPAAQFVQGPPLQWGLHVAEAWSLRSRTLSETRVTGAPDWRGPGVDPVDLENRLVRNRAASYLLAVVDDSMNGAGILAGDQVIVDRSLVAEHGQVVVAVIEERYRVARLFRFNGKFELRAERIGREPVRVALDVEPFIWGVVVACVRAYEPLPSPAPSAATTA